MIDLECPSCGRMGSVPKADPQSRLVCKKCHTVFHTTATGRTILGEPPTPGSEKDKDRKKAHDHSAAGARARDHAEEFFAVGRTQAAVGLIVLGSLGLAYLVLIAGGGGEGIEPRALHLANAMLGGDLNSVKKFAKSSGVDGVSKWYDSVYPQVESLKKASPGKSVLASVFVTEENSATRKGEVILFFAPAAGSTRDQAIAKAASNSGSETTEPVKAVTQVVTYWDLDRGTWRLDDARTAQAVPPSWSSSSAGARR